MNRLLCADFAKLRKNKFFWLCIGGMMIFGIFMKAMEYIAMRPYGETPGLNSMLLTYSMVIGFLSAAFVSLFVGTEYSDGTIRNKLIIGHSRAAIYLSSLITSCAADLLICLAYLIPAILVGIPLCGLDSADFPSLLCMVLYSFVMTLAFTSLCTLVAMTCQNKALTAVITILGVCLLFVVSVYISAKLHEPETYTEITALADDGTITTAEETPNPGYVRGPQRKIYEFLDEFLPTGQSVILTRQDGTAATPFLPAYSAGITAAAAGIGIFMFRKKDIK